MITVVLIEDHSRIRAMIRELLEESSDLQLIGEAEDGLTGYNKVIALRPHVVVIDLGLWQFDGAASTQRLKTLVLDLTIIGMSAGLESFQADRMLEAGADACIAKEDMMDGLVPAIRKARGATLQVHQLFEEATHDQRRASSPSQDNPAPNPGESAQP